MKKYKHVLTFCKRFPMSQMIYVCLSVREYSADLFLPSPSFTCANVSQQRD